MRDLTYELAIRFLRYEPQTGRLFWKERSPELFAAGNTSKESVCKTWNKRFAGKEAFTASNTGYRYGAIFAQLYLAHRVIWLMVHKAWPEDQIDHINGDRADNRIKNLRAVTNRQNCKNQCARSDNSTGVTGVYWFKRDSRWVSSITSDGKTVHLGYFDSFEDAVNARKIAEAQLGFHANHGRAAA